MRKWWPNAILVSERALGEEGRLKILNLCFTFQIHVNVSILLCTGV